MEPPSPVRAVENSANAKLGSCSATYVSQRSCPRDCPFFNAGCYAEHGLVGIHTRQLNRSPQLSPVRLARREARAVDRLSGTRLLRLHVVGDARSARAARVLALAALRYVRRGRAAGWDRKGKWVWTYTHAWQRVPRSAWGPEVSVLASCESASQIRAAWSAGYAAAVVVGPFVRENAYDLAEGVRVVPCPNQTRGVTCDLCRLCLDDERLLRERLAIAFAAHGKAAVRVRMSLSLV